MIEIKTQEQLVELAARTIYLLSGLRAFQREYEETRAIAPLHKDRDTELWEIRTDEFLKNIDCLEFESLKEIIAKLNNITSKTPITT